MHQYGVGIVGYGGMASWHHKQLNTLDAVKVVGAYDIDPARLSAAEKQGIKVYDSLEKLLGEGEIDIVIVATPNNFHRDISIAAMKAGKHVICEKPVAMTSEELQEMIDVSQKEGVIFSVHQNRRWDKDYQIVRSVMDEGVLGKPYFIESRVLGSRGVPEGWRQHKVAGGGMLYDWGVHLIDQVMFMIPEKVAEVYAHMFNMRIPEVDDCFKLLMKFESGLSVQIEVGTYCFIPLPRWHITGDKGTLILEDWSCKGKIVRANQLEMNWEEEIVYTSAGPTKTMAPRSKETIEELPLPEVTTDSRKYYENIIAVIEGREELIVKPQQAMRVMKVIEAAFESNTTGQAIHLNL